LLLDSGLYDGGRQYSDWGGFSDGLRAAHEGPEFDKLSELVRVAKRDSREGAMADEANAPTKFSRTDLRGNDKPKCRVIIPAPRGGWSEPVLFEWELAAESWTDEHPHSEYNFVIEGQLFVESGGVTVEAQAGDVVRVPAGAVGRYWAPKYARLLAIYGPSEGGLSRSLGYEKLSGR
jgi:mannose-6-phosphate isomerase-like protein (cupin superfamily)